MFGSKQSLNPLANSFVPKSKSEALREVAVKSVTELWEKKKANGEKTVTNEEIAKLVGHFISIGLKDLTDLDKIKIQKYLNKKLLYSKVPVVRPVSDLCKIRTKLSMKHFQHKSFNVSKVETPNVPSLLIAFWGLYRHEQAQRPLLSLTYRSDIMKHNIWSVDESDNKLWNPSCVSNVCQCPPIFGYAIPSNFFGVSFLLYSCPEQKIHLNHYSESINGNELILTNNWHNAVVEDQLFGDVKLDTKCEADIDTLLNQFQTVMSTICSLLTKFSEEPESETEDEPVDEIDYFSSFWDDKHSNISYIPFSKQSRDTLFDDNDHPLLDVSEMCMEQEVPLEVQEMIRMSLSPKENNLVTPPIVYEEQNICDPPCSIWCDSANKDHGFEAVNKLSESEQDSKNLDGPIVDLVSLEQIVSRKKVEPVNIVLKPASSSLSNKMKSNQSFLSFGDWDPFSYEKKLDRVTAHTSDFTHSKDVFTFREKESVNSKFLNRRESWDDSDSGFVSYSSSEDDLFGEICERDSIWTIVNSKDSLWKPLPECVETNNYKTSFPYQRAQDFRSKRSVT